MFGRFCQAVYCRLDQIRGERKGRRTAFGWPVMNTAVVWTPSANDLDQPEAAMVAKCSAAEADMLQSENER